jgi:hypothetical protein
VVHVRLMIACPFSQPSGGLARVGSEMTTSFRTVGDQKSRAADRLISLKIQRLLAEGLFAPHQSPGEPGAASKKRASSISTCNTGAEAKVTDNAYASRQLTGSRQGS